MEPLTVDIHDLARGGAGVARLETGEVVFIPFTAPGDRVEIEILERKKNYAQGRLIRILTPSSMRANPACPHFTRCGGCSWQHLPYPLQFETKKKGLLHALKRSGILTEGIPVDELPADQPYHYRNRIQLHGNTDTRELGFFEPGTKAIVDLERCPIADSRINDRLAFYKNEGLSRFRGEFKLEIEVSESGEVRAAWNQRHAAFGFRQVNDEQNLKLQAWVAEHIQDADLLLDLYGGTGNLSRGLISRFREIECVDLYSRPDPSETLPPSFRRIRKDMDRWSQEPFPESLQDRKTSVIIDPPREGMAKLTSGITSKLSTLSVQSLILVGCDVDAFTRDTHQLQKQGYRLMRLGILDLFPQTPHVESLALFSR